jgi:hypothetical protein
VDDGNPGGGNACDTGQPGVCAAGTTACQGGTLVCSQDVQASNEQCNGLDDDCDGAVDDGDPEGGVACDGADTDLCTEGTTSCAAGALVCSDNTGSTVDLCNGADDDCDGASADGSEDPQTGTACDGADSDLCNEGTRSCAAGALVCSDNTGSTVDLCNGADDDCDAASADGSEDPQTGTACDGADGDLCNEGAYGCTAGALVCSDNTGTTVEVCNSLDDDCDGTVDEDNPCPAGETCTMGQCASKDIAGSRITPAGVVVDPGGIAGTRGPYDQTVPDIASDSAGIYLAVWADNRGGAGLDIFGARVDLAGNVLDPIGFLISGAPGDQNDPAIAFDGTNFLVVWSDTRSGGMDIYGSRVDPGGNVLNPAGIAVSGAPNNQSRPALVWGGSAFLVVWEDGRSGISSDIFGARVLPTGVVQDPGGINISSAANDQKSPSVAFDGMNFLVVWQDGRSGPTDIYGNRVSQGGVALNGSGFPISTALNSQGRPDLSFDGINYLVVWEDERNGPGLMDIFCARVAPSGALLDPAGRAISTAPNRQSAPTVTFLEPNYLVAWVDTRSGPVSDVHAARVDTAANVLDPVGIPVATGSRFETDPAATHAGGQYFVAWGEE